MDMMSGELKIYSFRLKELTEVKIEDEREAGPCQEKGCDESPDFRQRELEDPWQIEHDSMHAYQSAIAECRLDKHGSDQRPGDRLVASFEETQRADGIFRNREHAYLLTGGALQNLSIMSPDIELLFA